MRPPKTADPSTAIADPTTASDDIDYDSLEEPRNNLDEETEEYEDIDRDPRFVEGKNNDILEKENFDDSLTNIVDLGMPYDGEGDIYGDSAVGVFYMLVNIPLQTQVANNLLLMKKMRMEVISVTS